MMTFSDPESHLEIDSCPECYGLWFDGEELKRFFSSPVLSSRILSEEATLATLAPPHPAAHRDLTRQCPTCAQALFASQLGQTQVDYCLGCRGIWLDRRELDQLVAAFQAGERGNLLIVNQLIEGLGTASRPNPNSSRFLETLDRYRQTLQEDFKASS